MKRVFGYVRVSTQGQAEEGFSLDHQEGAIKEYCKGRGFKLVRIFRDDGKSARTTNRPEFLEMLRLVNEKLADTIVVYKLDRFARNLADFGRIRKELSNLEVELISITEGNGGGVQGGIMAVIAEWESDANSQRTKDALMEKFKTGWQPTAPPIGYRSMGGEGERKYCEIDPYTGPIIKQMFQLYSTGQYSMLTLQEWLKNKNIISKNGTDISLSRINNILNDPFYYGLIRWHGESKMGKHTPLINKQLFDICQYILAKHRHFLVRERKYDFLLRGFAYCTCGMRLVGDYSLIRSSHKKLGYYHCQKRYSTFCKQKYIQSKELERQVEEYIKRLEFDDGFIAQVQQKADDFLNAGKQNTQSAGQGLVNQKTGLEIKRNRIEELVVNGTMDKETYNRKHTEVVQQIENLQTQIDEVEEESKLDRPLVDEVLSLTRNIYRTYKSAPDPLKRHYLRFFYDSLTINNKVISEVKPTPIFEALLCANMVRLRPIELPSSEGIIAALDKIFLALQDTVQMESVRSKWEEIKKLSSQTTPSLIPTIP